MKETAILYTVYIFSVLALLGLLFTLTSCTTASIDMRQCKDICSKHGVKSMSVSKQYDEEGVNCVCRDTAD